MTDFDYRSLDNLIHSRIRLAVVSILASVEFAEFTYLRDAIGATNGNLGTHLGKLEDAGYVTAEKLFVSKKPTTRYRLTAKGREALQTYVGKLGQMLGPSGGD